MPAYLIGELAAIIGMIAMFASGETVRRPETLRTVLGCLHGLAVFAGLELVLWDLNYGPDWLQVAFRLGNVFNFVVVGAMLSIVYPERTDSGSTWPMWEVTLGPFALAALWAALSQGVFGVGGGEGLELLVRPARALAVHYYLVSGAIIVMLLFDPPPAAPAHSLPLRERLTSGFGLFWLALMALWWGQAWFLLRASWTEVFGASAASAVVGGVLSLAGVYRTARHGHRQVHG